MTRGKAISAMVVTPTGAGRSVRGGPRRSAGSRALVPFGALAPIGSIAVGYPHFLCRMSAASTDVVSGNPAMVEDIDGHGTMVASAIAARRHQARAHGVAFRTKLLAVRAAAAGSRPGSCAFDQAPTMPSPMAQP